MLYTFDGASLCSLVAGLCNWLPLVVTAGYSSYSESVLIDKAHPIDQLLELPGVGSLDADSVCTLMKAWIHAPVQEEGMLQRGSATACCCTAVSKSPTAACTGMCAV